MLINFDAVWMMVVRRRISAVSYLNTVPFIYGMQHAGVDLHADLLLSPPSGTAAALRNHQADIALVPVAAIPSIPGIRIVSDMCIGAHDAVRTVVLVSNTPVAELEKIYLDSHSVTSALLVKILAAEKWNIAPGWETLDDYSVLDDPQGKTGYLLIGDKVFGAEGKFRYVYDLAEEWIDMTSLPFVFAAWVATDDVDDESIAALSKALKYGTGHIAEAIEENGYGDKEYAYDYLTKNIDFLFDEQKKQAMKLFWDKGMKVAPLVNPG